MNYHDRNSAMSVTDHVSAFCSTEGAIKILVTAATLRGGDRKERGESGLGQMQPPAGRCPWTTSMNNAYAAARHLVFSGLAPRQPKQPQQMENNLKAPTKLICKIKRRTFWVITQELALLHVQGQHPGQRCCLARIAHKWAAFMHR